METQIKKGKTANGEIAELTVDKENNPISIKVPSFNEGKEIPIIDRKKHLISEIENVIFIVPKVGKYNDVIFPRKYAAFLEDEILYIGMVRQYFRAGAMVGNTLVTRKYRCKGAYPFGKEVRGRLTIYSYHDTNDNIKIVLEYYIYENQNAPIGEIEKEISFKEKPTLNKTIMSIQIPGEKNMVLINKRRREKTFPILCA